MALSGSYNYTQSVSRADVIEAAYKAIGMVAKGDDPSANETADAVVTLNLMLKSAQGPPSYWARGLKLWKRERIEVTLVADQVSYSLKPSGGDEDVEIPIRILSALRRNSSDEDTPMEQINLAQYESIPSKSAEGSPSKFYYERRLTEGKLYLDCAPADTTETVELVVQYPLNDMDAAANTFDFPPEWFEAVKYNLAVRLAAENGIPVSQDLAILAQSSVEAANSFDQEETDLYFEPGRD